ncbi:tyrosinase family oxidase copper chaperone [Streptomyces laurentii]|uniref:tyrosinase family oxidase copper chaperone n=1 Tax=Streptomyces laurentii TaxID=39478 RepID=UPI00367F4352
MIVPRLVSRRSAVRSLFALSVTAFTGGALGRIASAGSTAPPPLVDPVLFDELYAGRRIQGLRGAAGGPIVLVDGLPLHLMRCADGGWVTPVDHYEICPTPLAATRAAVDALGPARPSRLAAAHGAHAYDRSAPPSPSASDHGPGARTGGSPRGVHA